MERLEVFTKQMNDYLEKTIWQNLEINTTQLNLILEIARQHLKKITGNDDCKVEVTSIDWKNQKIDLVGIIPLPVDEIKFTIQLAEKEK